MSISTYCYQAGERESWTGSPEAGVLVYAQPLTDWRMGLVPGVHEMRALNPVITEVFSSPGVLCLITSVLRAEEMICKDRGIWVKSSPHCICILEYNKTLKWAVLGKWAFWMVFVSFPAVSCHSVLLLACLLLATPVPPSWLLPCGLWNHNIKLIKTLCQLSVCKLCGKDLSYSPSRWIWADQNFWGLIFRFKIANVLFCPCCRLDISIVNMVTH